MTYFRRLAAISSPAQAERYRNVLVPNSKAQADADEYFLDNEPAHASMLRTSISPNILGGGYRVNVIPSEASRRDGLSPRREAAKSAESQRQRQSTWSRCARLDDCADRCRPMPPERACNPAPRGAVRRGDRLPRGGDADAEADRGADRRPGQGHGRGQEGD